MRVCLLVLAGCGRIAFDPLDSPLLLPEPAIKANLNTVVAIEPRGGVPPYRYAIASGTGELDDATGQFRCGSFADVTTIEVSDDSDASKTLPITCGGDYLYAAGGTSMMMTRDSVWRSRDGAQWSLVGTLPAPLVNGGFLVFDDQLLYLSGADMLDGTSNDSVWTSSDGVTWTLKGHLPETREAAGFAIYRGRIWTAGGIRVASASYTNQVWSSADGITWQVEPAMPVQIHGDLLVPFRGELWSVAGHEAPGQVATIHAFDGSSWRTIGAVPAAGEYHGATISNDTLWVAGGLGLLARVVKTTDGAAWSDAAAMPAPRNSPGLFEHEGELWIVGGSPAQPLHSIDGGAWSPAGAFPLPDLLYARYAQFTPH